MEFNFDTKLMTPKTPVSRETWRTWEKKTFNIHRGVIDWNIRGHCNSIEEIAARIRAGVKTEFHPGWLRGFGFGAILRFVDAPIDIANICHHVDTLNKKNGVWQWVIVCFDEEKVALVIHTWLQGYLRPVYESLMGQLSASGYQCESVDAEIDKLFVTLRRIATVCKAIKIVGGSLGSPG
jgi:hypothetical protein